jgi:hypothetical protein
MTFNTTAPLVIVSSILYVIQTDRVSIITKEIRRRTRDFTGYSVWMGVIKRRHVGI